VGLAESVPEQAEGSQAGEARGQDVHASGTTARGDLPVAYEGQNPGRDGDQRDRGVDGASYARLAP
jgi:hypothetical protein